MRIAHARDMHLVVSVDRGIARASILCAGDAADFARDIRHVIADRPCRLDGFAGGGRVGGTAIGFVGGRHLDLTSRRRDRLAPAEFRKRDRETYATDDCSATAAAAPSAAT